MLDFLAPRLKNALRSVNSNRLYELRIRTDKPLRINLGGKFCYLGERGVCLNPDNAIYPTAEEVETTLFAASDYSVYAVENQLKNGFVTGRAGERIGVAGTVVYDENGVLTVRSITSLCIRIPHAIAGCSREIYERCFASSVASLLILAPPGEGKTTILRDLTRLISERTNLNILVSDERGELSAGDLGATSDVICFADKLTAFTAGIRAMRPDIIVTDELLDCDYAAVKRARESGITVLASAHLRRYDDVPQKLFDYYVLLDGLGKVGKILRSDGNELA